VLDLLVLGVQLAPQLVDLALEQVALGLPRYRYTYRYTYRYRWMENPSRRACD
jgi:hypothetical protein